MGGFSIWHWVIVLLVIVLLFGAKRIPELAKGLGSGIKNFKKAVREDEEEEMEKDEEPLKPTRKIASPKKPRVTKASTTTGTTKSKTTASKATAKSSTSKTAKTSTTKTSRIGKTKES